MTLNQIARDYRDEICGGIPWVVVYKQGRSWYAKAFWPEDGEYDTGYTFDSDDIRELEEITMSFKAGFTAAMKGPQRTGCGQ